MPLLVMHNKQQPDINGRWVIHDRWGGMWLSLQSEYKVLFAKVCEIETGREPPFKVMDGAYRRYVGWLYRANSGGENDSPEPKNVILRVHGRRYLVDLKHYREWMSLWLAVKGIEEGRGRFRNADDIRTYAKTHGTLIGDENVSQKV